jgi:uncharacterized protein (DUF1697 family)
MTTSRAKPSGGHTGGAASAPRSQRAPTFVALLRGVNVGGANRLPMAGLREMLLGLGYADVSTLLASGNAVFRCEGGAPPRLATAIGSALAETFGIRVPVIVKSAADLDAVVAENPFTAPDPSRLLVAIAPDPPSLALLAAIAPLVAPAEQFLLGRHAAYLHCPDGILKSKAGDALLGKLGRGATTRNWATVLKLRALAGAAAHSPTACSPKGRPTASPGA